MGLKDIILGGLSGAASSFSGEDNLYLKQKDAARRRQLLDRETKIDEYRKLGGAKLEDIELGRTIRQSGKMGPLSPMDQFAANAYDRLATMQQSRYGGPEYVYDKDTGEFKKAPGRVKIAGGGRDPTEVPTTALITRIGQLEKNRNTLTPDEQDEFDGLNSVLRSRSGLRPRRASAPPAEQPGFWSRLLHGGGSSSGGLPGVR